MTREGHSLDITIRTATGTGRTLLSAYDHALLNAGVGDFNLIKLSSVVPPHSRISVIEGPVDEQLAGGHGDKLYCVQAAAFAEHSGETAWAGLGWVVDDTGAGLFVEHHAGSEESLQEQIELSLADMDANRGHLYGPVQSATVSAHYGDQPTCALVIAAYAVEGWFPKVDAE